ncbi:MAG: LysR family transcriptional regulator [Acidobacteriota bacterium]
MDLRHLQTFQTVLREGSFLKAARSLGISQPTVTLHIQVLEAEAGLELFDRSGRRRVPTPAGELLAARGAAILDALGALGRSMDELRDGRGGLLRLGAIEPAASQRLMPLLGRLRRQRPALRVRLEVSGTGGVSRGVADAELDFGLCSAPPTELGLRFERLFSEEMALLMPRSHRLARVRPLRAAHLAGEPLLLTELGCAYRGAVDAELQKRGVQAQWALECGSTATLRAAVEQGMGIAVLPLAAAQPAPAGTMVRRLSDLEIALPVGLVSRPDAAPEPPALAAFTLAVRGALGDRPSRLS